MKANIILKILITLSLIVLLNSFECGKKDDSKEDCDSNRWVAHKNGELLVDGPSMWVMSIADLNGAIPNAEKNCHARMTLEFWFKNKDLAMTNAKPPLSIVFFGGGGYFDQGSVSTYITQKMLDNSYYWTAYCDQAAKNAPGNPIDYGVSVTWDYDQLLSLEDVVLSGSIDYKIYKEP